jgi:hypothetical protein
LGGAPWHVELMTGSNVFRFAADGRIEDVVGVA